MLLQAISPGEVATEFVPRMRGIKNPTNEMIQHIYATSFAHVVSMTIISIPYSGLISSGEIFVDWIVKTFCGYIFKDYN